MVREDVTGADDAAVAPRHDGAVGTIGSDGGAHLTPGRSAQGTAVHRPGGVHDSRAQYVLGEDVGAGRGAAQVVPGDDRATGAVRDDGGKLLTPRRRAHVEAIGGPAGVRRPGRQHVLREDVDLAGPQPAVRPGNVGPARAIGGDHQAILHADGGAQRGAVGRPGAIDLTGPQHVLGEDVGAGDRIAVVLPGDDRTTRAVRDDHRSRLPTIRGRQRDGVGEQGLGFERPQWIQVAVEQHVLGEDVDGRKATVLPGDDRAARPVGGDRGVLLVVGEGADRLSELGPVRPGGARVDAPTDHGDDGEQGGEAHARRSWPPRGE